MDVKNPKGVKNMEKIKVCLDRFPFALKPTNEEAASISKRIGREVKEFTTSESIHAFVRDVCLDGRTFCPATFKDGRRCKENFEQQQFFALDFDNKDPSNAISFNDIKNRSERYELPILFAYDTLSSENHDKFRVVFLNDNPVTDIRAAELILKGLTTIFPEADPASKSAVQMYYGGKEVIYHDDSCNSLPLINIESVMRNTINYLEDRYKANHYSRYVEKFYRDSGIYLNDQKQPEISIEENLTELTGASVGKNLQNPIMYIPFGRNFPKRYYQINLGRTGTNILSEKKKNNYHRAYDSTFLNNTQSHCQLLYEFTSGERKLHHQELFGIITNLLQVQTGERVFIDLLREHGYYNEEQHYAKWKQDLRRMKDYKPFSCNNYCPYSDACPHGKNILSTVKPKYHKMEKLTNHSEHLYTIDDAYDDFNCKFLEFVNSIGSGWFVIKAQTATGKTEAILDFLTYTDKCVLIAVPTNKLKRELKKRAKQKKVKIIVSPSLHELENELPDEIWDELEKLLESGKPRMSYINKIIKENKDGAEVLKKYKYELDKFKNCEGHAITTHRNLLTMDTSKYDLVIVDEDIIFNSIIPNRGTISIPDLKKLRKELNEFDNNDPLAIKISKILKHNEEIYYKLKEVPYEKTYADISMPVDISALCAAQFFCFREASPNEGELEDDCVTFVNQVKFNKDTKFIMVSATVDQEICEMYFGEENVTFYECLKARNKGTLKIYPGRSWSRSDLKRDPAIISRIIDKFGFYNAISFKTFMQHYHGDLHYGNCAGCDTMKGEDLGCIGTPHQPEWIYKLFAYSLKRNIDISEELKPNTTITHNGYRCRFTTYDDLDLRNIQFYMIESQAEQAIGRARLLRYECTVHFFGNFPLYQAEIVEDFDYSSL
jgi:hypothetical protein